MTEGQQQQNLQDAAHAFAEQLSRTIGAVIPSEHSPRFHATTLAGGDKMAVETADDNGITLTAQGAPLLRLAVNYQCGWDGPGRFLAVHASEFHVWSALGESGGPLFRYEFIKRPRSGIPTAHLQVHAHRDAVTHAMSNVGTRSARARRRGKQRGIGRMELLHFPLGGARFRPALEDVLQMLVDEFGIDADDQWQTHLNEGRIEWRQQQLRAAIRDDQRVAAETLVALGYNVDPPPGGHPEALRERLSRF